MPGQRVDLHNHSCLSPCGDLSMSPAALVRAAARAGIEVLALTDHNSARNCPPFEELCRRAGIVPIAGIEAMPREEVHVLCLFGPAAAALDFGAWLRTLLPAQPFDPGKFGDQPVVDADENILGFEERYLGSALDLGLEELAAAAVRAGGLVVPAHIDRPMYSMRSQLGFLPEGPWAAVEVRDIACDMATGPYPVIRSSDAHHPDAVGQRAFRIEAERGIVDLPSLAAALAGGRIEL